MLADGRKKGATDGQSERVGATDGKALTKREGEQPVRQRKKDAEETC